MTNDKPSAGESMLAGKELASCHDLLGQCGYDFSAVHPECYRNFSYIKLWELIRPPVAGAEVGTPDAWEWRACIGGKWGAWLHLDRPIDSFRERNGYNLNNGTYELRPLYALSTSVAERGGGGGQGGPDRLAIMELVKRVRKYNAAHLAWELSNEEAVDAVLAAVTSPSPTPETGDGS